MEVCDNDLKQIGVSTKIKSNITNKNLSQKFKTHNKLSVNDTKQLKVFP